MRCWFVSFGVPAPETRMRRPGVAAARAAFVVGALYALLSAYWGAGGTQLLDTIGGSLEREGRAHNVLLLGVVWLGVVLKLVAAAAGLLATDQRLASRWYRPARLSAWTAAVSLTLYGGLFTAVGLLVQGGLIQASDNADQRALRWHTYLWDPWFLVWGALLTAALLRSRPHPRARVMATDHHLLDGSSSRSKEGSCAMAAASHERREGEAAPSAPTAGPT